MLKSKLKNLNCNVIKQKKSIEIINQIDLQYIKGGREGVCPKLTECKTNYDDCPNLVKCGSNHTELSLSSF
jgi:hypothetical protein